MTCVILLLTPSMTIALGPLGGKKSSVFHVINSGYISRLYLASYLPQFPSWASFVCRHLYIRYDTPPSFAKSIGFAFVALNRRVDVGVNMFFRTVATRVKS